MARSKKPDVPDPKVVAPAFVPGGSAFVAPPDAPTAERLPVLRDELTAALDDLIATCSTEDEWKLRRYAEHLEAQAKRLRAEWLRRRGGRP